ncbi:MAG: corrinoid protein [Candidatus Adiutrix sp.]|jgi:corrinoid protein of di/trimethylamine methyltransferase|nr:corrinoid protein [Candidatus Adiutrix sp.]
MGGDKIILDELAKSVLEMDEDLAQEAAQRAIEAKIDPKTAIADGLSKGMEAAGVKYEEEEYFVPELLLCSDAMYAGLDILRPHIRKDSNKKGCAVIGVVEGDTHDIGKNLVKLFMETHGFDMIDLGRDVLIEKFVETVKNNDVQVVCMSTLMTTTMAGMKTVIERLKEEGLRDKVKVIIGGAPISRAFAAKIGADAYSSTATEAPLTADGLVSASGGPATSAA